MKENKLIQWDGAKYWDKPWNPIIGCEAVSPACEHCYAKAIVNRFNNTGVFAPDFKPTWKPESSPPKNGVTFCGNMTDLFGEWLPFAVIGILIRRATYLPNCVRLWLTKRARRMEKLLQILPDDWPLDNHYFGFTAENREWFDRRWSEICSAPKWAKLWLSAEPLLGPIDFGETLPEFKWVVVGCESGRGRRPCKMEWVEDVVEQCRAARVPVFVKQLDFGRRCIKDIEQFPEHLRIRQVPWAEADQ